MNKPAALFPVPQDVAQAALFTRNDLGEDGTNYPHIRALLDFAETAIQLQEKLPSLGEPAAYRCFQQTPDDGGYWVITERSTGHTGEMQLFAGETIRLNEQKIIEAFLDRSGQYVTNDASREATIAEARREALEEAAKYVENLMPRKFYPAFAGISDGIRALQPSPAPVGNEVADEWYLQDTRSYVGNDVMWWAKDGNGYTTDVSKAHVYGREEAFRKAAMRGTDRAWPKAYIDGKTRPAVDMQYINHVDAIANSPDAGKEAGS